MKLLWIISIFFILREADCDVVCTAPGRFPNNTRNDCRGYVMCLKGATSITHYNLVCPEQSIYSHIDNQCTNVTSYQCLTNHTCSQEGNFVNNLSDNCDSYIACIQDLKGIVSARIIKCPEDMIFSAAELLCVNSTIHSCTFESPQVQAASEAPVPQSFDNSKKSSAYGPSRISSALLSVLFLHLFLHFKQ